MTAYKVVELGDLSTWQDFEGPLGKGKRFAEFELETKYMGMSSNAADPGKQDEALGYNASAVEPIGAAASATFAGRYEKSKTGFFGRLLLRILRKPEQDNVDRAADRAWAQELVEL